MIFLEVCIKLEREKVRIKVEVNFSLDEVYHCHERFVFSRSRFATLIGVPQGTHSVRSLLPVQRPDGRESGIRLRLKFIPFSAVNELNSSILFRHTLTDLCLRTGAQPTVLDEVQQSERKR